MFLCSCANYSIFACSTRRIKPSNHPITQTVAVPTDNDGALDYTVAIMIIRLIVIVALAILSVVGLIVLGRLAEDRHD